MLDSPMEKWVSETLQTSMSMILFKEFLKTSSQSPDEIFEELENMCRNLYTEQELMTPNETIEHAESYRKMTGQDPANVEFDNAVNKVFGLYKEVWNKEI